MTPEERQAAIAARLYAKKQTKVVWGNIVSAIASADSIAKGVILDAASEKDHGALANALMGLILAKLAEDANTEAADYLADDSINLDELDEIL